MIFWIPASAGMTVKCRVRPAHRATAQRNPWCAGRTLRERRQDIFRQLLWSYTLFDGLASNQRFPNYLFTFPHEGDGTSNDNYENLT